jgi:deoxyribodipyrimidine photo-lyase
MQKLEDEPEQELENIHPFYAGLRPRAIEDAESAARLKAWSEGLTGFPFVDACMRSLNATGWINFRMRAMLMSFASYHLWLDWRDSGLLYAQKFTDYEPGIHWPQVQMQSGTTGINTVRMYNPVKQGYDQDPEGSFTRKWVPELADIPDPFLQEPWKWPDPKETIPTRYPARVIDHVKAGKEARDKIYAVRRRDGHRDIAKAIAAKHGSRKRR